MCESCDGMIEAGLLPEGYLCFGELCENLSEAELDELELSRIEGREIRLPSLIASLARLREEARLRRLASRGHGRV